MELIALAKEREKIWEELGYLIHVLEDFLFKELLEIKTQPYNLMDLFSRDAILAIIKEAALLLTLRKQGKAAIRIGGGGGDGIVPPSVTDNYATLIQMWQQAGWVDVQFNAASKEVKINLMF